MGDDIKLKVAEAIQDDVNKGIVRIDSSFMQELGVKPGDIIEITGPRKTVAIVDRAYPGDIGLPIIRMDGLIRRNAGTGIGEAVIIKKADFKEAKKIVIAPASKGVMMRASPELFKRGLLGRVVVKGDIVSLGGAPKRRSPMPNIPDLDIFDMMNSSLGSFGLADIKFIVVDVTPKGIAVITESTVIEFNPEAVEVSDEKVLEVTYEDIGGLDEELKKIREMVELPLKHPELFERLGIEAPKGVLLHGPPGTGKTMLAKAVANETNSNFILINGPELMSKFYGQSEANIRKKFEEAEKDAPSIIFIDEIDAIAPKREETHGEVEKRVVATILALMDGLKSRGKVVVIAATNIPNSIDPALRRPGRFDREIEIGVPTVNGRKSILRIHTRMMPLLTKPESLHKNYSTEEILDEIKSIFEKIDVNHLLSSIMKNAKDKKEFKESCIPILKDIILKLVSKKTNKAARDFITENQNLTKFAEVITDEILNHIMVESKTIKTDGIERQSTIVSLKENAIEKLKERFKEIQKDDGIKDIVSKIVKGIIIEDIASMTHGFVGADLAALTKEAAMTVLRRILPDLDLDKKDPIPEEILKELHITREDFKDALKTVRPSALREVFVEIPNVRWDNIGGLDIVKQELKEAVEWPLKNPAMFTRLGVKPPKGILLYGPPGSGKTMLAKAVANESQANFITVKGSDLMSKWVNETPQLVKKMFKKARQASPCIIFIDEIDSIAMSRTFSDNKHSGMDAVHSLLSEMDGLEEINDIVIIAATNRPDIIDPALLRPGRFDRIILTPAPDKHTRKEIFKIHTKSMPINISPDDSKTPKKTHDQIDALNKKYNLKLKYASTDELMTDLANVTEGYVGADIESVCREAAILTLRKDMNAKTVEIEGFLFALDKVKPSVTKDIENEYKDLQNLFSSAVVRRMKAEKPAYFG